VVKWARTLIAAIEDCPEAEHLPVTLLLESERKSLRHRPVARGSQILDRGIVRYFRRPPVPPKDTLEDYDPETSQHRGCIQAGYRNIIRNKETDLGVGFRASPSSWDED